jgi:hypothetical protein
MSISDMHWLVQATEHNVRINSQGLLICRSAWARFAATVGVVDPGTDMNDLCVC